MNTTKKLQQAKLDQWAVLCKGTYQVITRVYSVSLLLQMKVDCKRYLLWSVYVSAGYLPDTKLISQGAWIN